MRHADIIAFGANQPAFGAAVIVPDDATDLPGGATRFLLVGIAGDVAVDMMDSGTNVVLKLPAGIQPVRVKRVRATLTTATNLVALY